MGGKLPESYPRGEGSPLPALLDEREEPSELVHYKPDYTRLRAALRQLDNQLVRNLAHFGFTPSDRARLGLVRVRQQSKLEELMARRHNRDLVLEEQRRARENGKI